jgi:hypothetical protein
MDTGIPMSLETPAGTLVLNDYQSEVGCYMVDKITGMDGASIRNPIDNLPQRDGAVLHPFFRGPRIFTIEGLIVGPTPTLMTSLQNGLIAACESTIDTVAPSARFFFDPPGQQTRFVQCKVYDPLEISPDGVGTRRFAVTLIAPDPVAYTYTQQTVRISGSGTVWNYGNAITWPVVKVYGGSFTLSNDTVGLSLTVTGAPVSGYAEIVMARETIYLNGDSSNLLKYVDMATSDFWYLVPGPNAISSGAPAEFLTNSAWV